MTHQDAWKQLCEFIFYEELRLVTAFNNPQYTSSDLQVEEKMRDKALERLYCIRFITDEIRRLDNNLN